MTKRVPLTAGRTYSGRKHVCGLCTVKDIALKRNAAKHAELVRLVREYFTTKAEHVAEPTLEKSIQHDRARHALINAAAVRGDTEGECKSTE